MSSVAIVVYGNGKICSELLKRGGVQITEDSMGGDGGIVVSILASYSDDWSLNSSGF